MFFFLINRRPPRSTRTDTRFPYTTLFRSTADRARDVHEGPIMSKIEAGITSQNIEDADGDLELTDLLRNWARWANHGDDGGPQQATTCASAERHHPIPAWEAEGSEERRVGKEGGSTGRTRWAQSP